MVAEALAAAVRQQKGFVVHVASSGREAITVTETEHPDVVLIDAEMPGMDGIEAIRRVRESHPSARVVMLSSYEDDLMKARAVEAGAVGYISKLTPLAEVPPLVRRARDTDSLIDPDEQQRLLRHLRHRRHQESTERQRVNRLTPRQVEILQLIADGVPGPDVAHRLGMSHHTLRTHVQNILTRLGVHTKLEAVAMAIRHGKVRTV